MAGAAVHAAGGPGCLDSDRNPVIPGCFYKAVLGIGQPR
jgi:hypothetical protein